MTYQNKKIGILGGSFDPIHNGHLAIAESAYRDYNLDEVWLIPAGHSPNKDEAKMTSATERAEMVALAIQDISYFRLSMYEIEKEDTSFTYLTLSDFKDKYPDTDFYFIMGADSLDYFETWKHPEIICEKAVVLVAVRDDMDLEDIQNKIMELKAMFHAQIYPLSCSKIDISSSDIRTALINNSRLPSGLPEKVADYIQKNCLYQDK